MIAKYRNRETTINNIRFDSGREARRYSQLLLMQQAGEISNLERQITFELIPKQRLSSGKCERACKYILDFRYTDKNGVTIFEDTKGFKTPDYVIKQKLMLFMFGIEILET